VFALGSRALAYFQKGNYAAADEDVASGLKLAPNNPSVLFVKAKLDLRRGSSDAEIDSLSKLIETGPDKGYAYVQRAHAYYRMGRYDAALADTDQALKLGYKGADLRVVRANIFMLRDQRDAVAAEADAMVRGNPDTYAYAAAAKTYAAIGQRQKAMQLFDRALAVKADGVIYVNRAQVRPYTDLDGRLADLDAALKLEPNNVDAIWAKASQLVLKGDYAGAIALYDRDAALEPDNAMVVLGRAEALYKSGRRAEAETLLNDRRTRIRSAGDFYALCWAEARANMFLETALGDCNKASELNPSTRTDGKAFVLLRLNRIDEAIAAFTAALALDRSAFNYLGRAFAWARKGDRARAEADRAEALKRNADEELQFAEYGLKFDDKPASTAAATKAATAGKN
jgi:tetratricopeptide (TPR) repeat protein